MTDNRPEKMSSMTHRLTDPQRRLLAYLAQDLVGDGRIVRGGKHRTARALERHGFVIYAGQLYPGGPSMFRITNKGRKRLEQE